MRQHIGALGHRQQRETHELKFGFAPRRHLDGLHALLARNLVVEAEECLVRLHALALFALHYLEREL